MKISSLSISAQARAIMEHYERLRMAPPGTPIEFCQDTKGNWYPGSTLIEWNEGYLIIQEDEQQFRLNREDINELRHSFVPMSATAEALALPVLQAA
jgi:hypothetical protein